LMPPMIQRNDPREVPVYFLGSTISRIHMKEKILNIQDCKQRENAPEEGLKWVVDNILTQRERDSIPPPGPFHFDMFRSRLASKHHSNQSTPHKPQRKRRKKK